MKRVLCAWLPNWPLDRLARSRRNANRAATPQDKQGDAPFALVESCANALVIAAANAPARAGGVFAGQPLTAARAILPGLVTEPIDREADARALNELALWARRFSPYTAPDGCDGVALDVAGCAKLFEHVASQESANASAALKTEMQARPHPPDHHPDHAGELALMAKLAERLKASGVEARLALADTHAAAWGLARYAPGDALASRLIAPHETQAALASLPPAALGLDEPSVRLLARLGFSTIGELAAVPRLALERRFRSKDRARAALAALDRAFGRSDEPFSPLAAPPTRLAHIAPPEPLLTGEAIRIGVVALCEKLLSDLELEGRGARRVRLHVLRADGGGTRIEVAASRPCREPEQLMRLFDERLGEIDPGFGVDRLVLEALSTESLAATPGVLPVLKAAPGHDDEAAAQLIDRLAARFGARAVHRLAPRDSWSPERAQTRAPHGGPRPDWSGQVEETPPRPPFLLDPPEPVTAIAELPDSPPARFTWRRKPRRVVRAQGPERIAPEWWRHIGRGPARVRDYYAVEDEDGRRYWLYREGLYDDPAAPPVWRMHGLFP